MQEEKTAYVYEEKNGNCPCARGRREGERCDVSPEKMDYLAMSHSAHAHANCLCLAEGDLLSHGVRARQGSARAEATSQGPEDIAGALGGKPRVFCREGEWNLTAETVAKLYSTVFALAHFFFDSIPASKKSEKPHGKM